MKTVFSLLLAAFAAAVTAFSGAIAGDVRAALERCAEVLIPSLFAPLAASELLLRSGGYRALSRVMKPFSRLMGLPEEQGAVFLLANAAGYPAGAALIASMRGRGLDRRSAEGLMCFCCNGGFAFFAGVTGSARGGLMVWLIVLAANLLTAAVVCRLRPIAPPPPGEGSCGLSRLLPDSVAAAGRALFRACTMILFFAAALSLMRLGCERAGVGRLLDVAAPFAEVTELSGSGAAFPLVCAAGAFGGACVHLQIKAIAGESFSVLPFLAARAVCAALAAAMAVPAGRFLYEGGAVQAAAVVRPAQGSLFPAVCLAAMVALTAKKVNSE